VEHSLIAVQRDKVRKDGGKGGGRLTERETKRDIQNRRRREKDCGGAGRSWESLLADVTGLKVLRGPTGFAGRTPAC
jgi:hypothetical protein